MNIYLIIILTILIGSYILDLVLDVDQILLLEGGREVEMGSHGELLAKNGSYSRLVASYQERLAPGGLK